MIRNMDYSRINWVCYSLLILGALNWGILGILDVNILEQVIDSIFQPRVGDIIARFLYALVGLAGLYFFFPLYRMSQAEGRYTP